MGEDVEQRRDLIGQSGISQAVDHQVHAQREDDDLPGRAFQDLAGVDPRATCCDCQEQHRADRGHGADWHAQRFQAEEADQQQREDHPAGLERGRVADRIPRCP